MSLAAVLDGMSREDAARIGGMDRQTLRDWVHRFNEAGPEGLKDAWNVGPEPRLSAAQKAELAGIVERGPDNAVDGVVRWRRVDLQKLIKQRFGVDYHERYVGTLLKELGFSHISARPRHPGQDGEIVEAYKKTSLAAANLAGLIRPRAILPSWQRLNQQYRRTATSTAVADKVRSGTLADLASTAEMRRFADRQL